MNALVFLIELVGGETFVTTWSLHPADIVAGNHLITILTSMFMHGSWSHILGNMVFLWAFGPEIEDLMTPRRYLVFYLLGGLAATAAQVAADPSSTVPNLGASGAIAAVMGAFLVTYPRDRIRSLLVMFIFVRVSYIPAALLIGVWFPDAARESGRGGAATARGRRRRRGPRWGIHLRRGHGAALRRSPISTGRGHRVEVILPAVLASAQQSEGY